MALLTVGDTAPQFTLLDQDGEEVSLADFSGERVLVYFYPKAMTQVVLCKPVACVTTCLR